MPKSLKKEQALEAVYNHLIAASSNALVIGLSYRDFQLLAKSFHIANAIDLFPKDKKAAMKKIKIVRQTEYHTEKFAKPLKEKLNKKYLMY